MLFKNWFIALIVFGIVDYVYLKFIGAPMFSKMILKIQNSKMVVRFFPALLAYLLLGFSVAYFVLPKISKRNTLRDSIIHGGLLGLVVYGVYDMTNLATIKHWNPKIALIDTIWGFTVYTLVSYITAKLLHR